MTQQDRIWTDFNLDDNCVHVTDSNRVRLYFAQFTLALTSLDRIVTGQTAAATREAEAIGQYVSRLVETFHVMALKYFYPAPTCDLKVDSTDSGFFHFSTLLELEADASRRLELLAQSQEVPALRRQLTDRIIRHRTSCRDIQEKIAQRLYLERLDRSRLFREFVPGPLVRTGSNDENTYFWSFATYDRSLNRPFIYLLYLNHDSSHPLDEDSPEFLRLIEHAERLASGRLNLLSFSALLDDAVSPVSPRITKRFILGPYWSPHFTRNEGEFSTLLEGHRDRFPFALRWETETLVSDREQRVGKHLLSRGRLKQVFWIPSDVDLSTRGVSHLERYLLAPHWFTQHIEAAHMFKDHRKFVIDQGDEVHGIH